MEEEQWRATLQSNYVYITLEEEEELWRQLLLFQEVWLRRHMLALQLLEQQQQPPPPPPPCHEFELDYNALTSFLEVDGSFFSPWNWNPNSQQDGETGNDRMVFQPDSFFSEDQELYGRMSGKDGRT